MPITVGKSRVHALLDTGADVSLVSSKLLEKVRSFISKNSIHPSKLEVRGVTGQSLKIKGEVELPVRLKSRTLPHTFVIVETLAHPMLLGSDFLSTFGAKLDFSQRTLAIGNEVVLLREKPSYNDDCDIALVKSQKTVCVKPRSVVFVPLVLPKYSDGCHVLTPLDNVKLFSNEPGLMMPNVLVSESKSAIRVPLVNETGRSFKVKKGQTIGVIESTFDSCENPLIKEVAATELSTNESKEQKFQSNLQHLTSENSKSLLELLNSYKSLFAEKDTELGCTDLVEMTLNTGDHPPIRQRLYRTPYSRRPIIDEHINDMLKANIIRPSTSPWSSPVVMVPKKDGSWRPCIDYRKINGIVSTQNSYPLPVAEDIFSMMNGAKVFSCLDLKSGYWQIKMAEKDKPKTAFTCFRGLYEFNVLPFGLTAAPPVFQELMNKVLAEAQGQYAIAFLDDIIVFSKTHEEHIEHLKKVFEKLKAAGLKLKLSKCSFCQKRVNYLGHIISESGIEPDPSKVAVIRELKPPETVREVRSFVGMASFYRRFIDHFSEIVQPLTNLTKKNVRFQWTTAHQEAFESLKEKLSSAPVLGHPNFGRPYKLYTDASLHAVGAVLTQEFPEGERVIQYLSKQLSPGQQKWPVIEREAYAIIFAVNKLRHFLLGSKFTIFTDHKPLRSPFTAEMKNVRVQRWAIMLAEYGCDVEYKSGKTNVIADMLSRIPPTKEPEEIAVIDSSHCKSGECEESSEDDSDYPEEVPTNPTLTQAIQKAQYEDPTVTEIIELLKGENDVQEYVVQDSLLYHISQPVKNDKHKRMQLVIPPSLQKGVMEEMHCSQYGGGHTGIDKTYDKLRTRYYWDGMYRDVVNFVNHCELCRAKKMRKARVPMQDMPIPEFPFEIVGIDTCGPFPTSVKGNKYIVTIVDHFSSWPEAYAVPDKTAETIASLLIEKFLPQHGCPKVMLSDRGTEFVNHIVGLLLEKLKVSHIKTSPFHPQGNGKTERFHRFMNSVLAKYTQHDQFTWDQYIPGMLMAYRTSVNDTTQFSPFFLVYGRDPVLPMDTLLNPQLRYMGEDYVPCMLQRLHMAYNEVKCNMQEARDRNKRRLNERATTNAFQAGDAVFYYDQTTAPGHSDKLTLHWKPHYRIVEQLSPVNFRIRHQVTGKSKVVHAENLQPAFPEKVWDAERTLYQEVSPESEETGRRFLPIRKTRLVCPDDTGEAEQTYLPRLQDSFRSQGPVLKRRKRGYDETEIDSSEPAQALEDGAAQSEAASEVPDMGTTHCPMDEGSKMRKRRLEVSPSRQNDFKKAREVLEVIVKTPQTSRFDLGCSIM